MIAKALALQIALLALPSLAGASQPPLEGQPFRPSQVEIEWKAPTNDFPKKLWVYKIVPQSFSGAVISNAMAIGSFEPRHLLNPRDKNLLQFQNSRERPTRYLRIAPASGWMTYYDGQAKAEMTEPVEGVPDVREAEFLARDYLQKLGIDRLQILSRRGYASDQTRAKVAKDGTDVNPEVIARGVSLVRQVDGIAFYGRGNLGGFWIDFGNKRRVAAFDLLWRGLLPADLHDTASAAEIVERIQAGESVLQVPKNLSAAKRLTILEVTPYYLGTPWEKPQDFLYPVAALKVAVGTSEDDTVELLCPFLAEQSRIIEN
jgi:hypothetical protein